jgi:tRNA(Ile)-lysidine synthase
MTRAAPRRSQAFGPLWLGERLAELLPGFPDRAVCVAFSGGADSTALLAGLAQLPRRPLKLRALHVDRGLNPDSARWARHCHRIARELGVPLAVRRARIRRARGESLEAAARTARYRLLGDALGEGEALLTAHHQDDQLETVLLQLLRGAGVAGVAAMPALAPLARGVLVRPLLGLSREALRAWVSAQALAWVEDDSNAQLHLDRNYLRERVLPAMRARWPSAAATVARAAQHFAEAQHLLDSLAAADVAGASCGALLSAKLLRRLSGARRRNALRYWISSAGALVPPTSLLNELAGALLSARADAQPFVAWEGARVQRHAELLSLHRQIVRVPRAAGAAARSAPPTLASAPPSIAWHWHEARSCALPDERGTLSLRRDARGPIDLDALGARLELRARRGGERLRPVRGGPRRALKKLLQEARVPPAQRAHLPLVFDGERLIAAADLWLDESVQARPGSPHRARLVWTRAR